MEHLFKLIKELKLRNKEESNLWEAQRKNKDQLELGNAWNKSYRAREDAQDRLIDYVMSDEFEVPQETDPNGQA